MAEASSVRLMWPRCRSRSSATVRGQGVDRDACLERVGCALSVSSAGHRFEPGVGHSEVELAGTAGSHGDPDAPHTGGDDGADLEECQSDGTAGRLGEARLPEADAAQGMISFRSPLAAAIMGASVGEIVEAPEPLGEIEILSVG